MRKALLGVAVVLGVVVSGASAGDRRWENPVFESADEAAAAARRELARGGEVSSSALGLFVDLTLAAGDVSPGHPSQGMVRQEVERVVVTHPRAFLADDVQRRTVERFLAEVPRQRALLERRLARFGYPELRGLVYCRLVDSVDAFAHLNRASSDRMSQVGGVTYYCRYVVLPLSYVGSVSLAELRKTAALNPGVNVGDTLRRWQSESFANLVNTFRHELVHVYTNSSLDVPDYSDRSAFPTWFHEGTATYLAADPHAGLSPRYREYQALFFYLVQRYGVGRLQQFYGAVLGGSDAGTALAEVYGLDSADRLFAHSARWHRGKELVKSGFWIVGLAIVVAAFRGGDWPYIGALQLLVGTALVLAVATGLAEHLYGLRGPAVVLGAKVGFGSVALALLGLGLRRVLRARAES